MYVVGTPDAKAKRALSHPGFRVQMLSGRQAVVAGFSEEPGASPAWIRRKSLIKAHGVPGLGLGPSLADALGTRISVWINLSGSSDRGAMFVAT